MKDNFDEDLAGSVDPSSNYPLRRNEWSGSRCRKKGHFQSQGNLPGEPPAIDYWVFIDILARTWKWLVLGGLIFAGGFFLLGKHVVKTKFIASAQLLRYETPAASDFFKAATPMSGETFSGLIRAPELLARVGERANPPMSADALVKCLKIDPEPDSDLVKVLLAAKQPGEAVDLLNNYIEEAVKFTSELQAKQADRVASDYLKQQVAQMDDDIKVLHQQFRSLPVPPEITNKLAQIGGDLKNLSQNLAVPRPPSPLIAKLTEKLQTALADLSDLTAKYQDIHPLVREKRAQIQALQVQIASSATNNSLPEASAAMLVPSRAETFNPELDIVRTRLLSLEEGRVQLANRQREAALYAANPPGIVRIFAHANLQNVATNWRWVKISMVSFVGGVMGVVFSLALVLLVELADNRLRTVADVERVTKMPVLATLGYLHCLKPEERSLWAFRAWTMLQGRLSFSPNHGLVCGITSSESKEGRSTWVNLLAEAASMTGFRVLTIATRKTTGFPESDPDMKDPPELAVVNAAVNADGSGPSGADASLPVSTVILGNVLASPAQVTEHLLRPDAHPIVHIPLPGWVWNLERRKQWRDALNQWRKIDNLVILVELPPADVGEAVLLGCNLPNLLWLTDSGRAEAGETRAQLQTLRHARCNLVGAVVNRLTASSIKTRFPRWLTCFAVLAAISSSVAQAQNTNEGPSTNAPGPLSPASTESGEIQTNRAFSIVSPSQRAAWQRHLTLGPGDVLTLGLYSAPDLQRAEVAVGPDGRISYLEAQDVTATGLTIDEFRAKLDEELGKYRRAPHSLVTPVAFHSKKYYMLGKVMTKGVYTLDRPITLLEAVARARGLENGLVDRNIIDLADLSHSFLARGGQRITLNFESLFRDGDLSQNIPIEPGDYLYFPPAEAREIYVLGEVRLPGPTSFNPEMTIIGAIAARGGFTDRAYRARVLVVRGSLDHPEKIAVDTHAIVDGKAINFRLQPKDIIYVSARPFIGVEELADLAITAFIQSAITQVVGVHVIQPVQ
jgi:protein involved in polysaccharide export with SLBB domain/capsular polysaccharide biosynthesis protein